MKRVFIALLLCANLGMAQSPADIDELFTDFDENHPAVAMVVIDKGEIIYQKAYGSIHLDHKIPATIDTKFQLGGLSKHFAAFAIFLLEDQGKLSMDDDIRKFITELPKYENVITIDHLLTQTSGFPDFWAMKNIAGWHRDDVFTQQHAMDIVTRMEPAFAPGEDFIYSNTNQLLLAEIISRVSGKSFAAFLKDELFDPLQMSNTLVMEDFEQFIPNVAGSYERAEDGFKRSSLNYGIVGPTNIYSSIADLAKWELNLSNPKVGSAEMIQRMYKQSKLNDGNTLDPLFGRLSYSQQLWHRERGIPNYYQSGRLGGYASAIFKFIDSDFTTIVLSSGMNYSGYLGMQTAYLYLEDEFLYPESIDYAALKTKKLSTKQLEEFEGTYWNQEEGYSRSLELKNDTLRYVRGPGNESALLPLSKNQFQMVGFGDEAIIVTFEKNEENQTMALVIGDSAPVYSSRVPSFSNGDQELDVYAGTYYCEALNTVYELGIDDGNLIAQNLKTGRINFTPVKEGVFESDRWFIGGIEFQKSGNEITGFTITNDQVPSLPFRKILN